MYGRVLFTTLMENLWQAFDEMYTSKVTMIWRWISWWYNKKQLKLPILVGPHSTIQPFSHSLRFNFLWSLSYIRKQYPVLGYGTQEYLTCTDTALTWYQFTPWSSGASEIYFLCPEEFTLGQCRIHGPLDLQSKAISLDQRAPMIC